MTEKNEKEDRDGGAKFKITINTFHSIGEEAAWSSGLGNLGRRT